MIFRLLGFSLLLAAAMPAADNLETRSKLYGHWEAADHSGWVFEDKGGDIHVARTAAEKTVSEVQCNTMGRDCKFKEDGRNASVSMWYIGPTLVQLETAGNNIIKRRFTVSADGKTLAMETIPVVPPGKPETTEFTRVETPASPTGERAGVKD